jgi:hypothetical protein
MMEGLCVQGASPGLFIDGDAGKPTMGALDYLECDLIRSTVRRELDPEPDAQRAMVRAVGT